MMAYNSILFKNPNTGETHKAPVGYCWTVAFFLFFVPIFRRDWKWAILYFLLIGIVIIIPPLSILALIVNILFFGCYNKLYIQNLIKKGFYAVEVEHGVLTEVINKTATHHNKSFTLLIPTLEESQTDQTSQEPEPQIISIKDKLNKLDELKKENLINNEEYNKKKEKLLEEL
jgi:hypothetical protein